MSKNTKKILLALHREQDLVTFELRRLKHEVISVTLNLVLTTVQNSEIDAVILDDYMSSEIIETLKADPRTASIPIMQLIYRGINGTYTVPADDFYWMPIEIQEFVRHIELFLDKDRKLPHTM